MHWLFIAILTATSFGIYNFLIKVSSGSIHEIAGAVILQGVAAFLGGCLWVYLRVSGTSMEYSARGVGFSCLAGLAVGIAEILTFFTYSQGIPSSLGAPVIIGGSVIVTVLLGALFLRESIHMMQVFAILLILGGVVILASYKQ